MRGTWGDRESRKGAPRELRTFGGVQNIYIGGNRFEFVFGGGGGRRDRKRATSCETGAIKIPIHMFSINYIIMFVHDTETWQFMHLLGL